MSRRRSGAGTVPLNAATREIPRRVAHPSPQNKAGGNADWFRIENVAADTTEIYIYDEIGYWGTSAQDFVQQMMAIDTPKIDLHLNSPGGEVFDGVAIYNALKSHSAYVTVYVDALAASAASFIAQSGDKVIMMQSATMMIHDALAICIGNSKDMQETANLLGKISNNIADIYAQQAGGTVAEWRAVMQEEAWYTPQEAVDAGLADEVGGQLVDNSTTNNKWDLSIFNYTGRQNAPSPDQVRLKVKNLLKEASVGNTADENQGTPPVEGQPNEGQPPVEQQPVEEQPEEGQPVKEGQPTEGQPSNKATAPVFIINGARVTDPAKVQAHINGLEGAQAEAKVSNRKAFIKNLCDLMKITAAQVDDLEALVIGDADEPGMTDKQYDRWTKTWNVAAPVAGLMSVVEGLSNTDGNTPRPVGTEAAKISDLDTAKEIVKNNKVSMPKAQLEKTPSWAKLVAAGIDPSTI